MVCISNCLHPDDLIIFYYNMINTGIKFNDWAIRKETVDDEPILKLYFETPEDVDGKYIQQKVHEALKEQNSDFADYEAMIEKSALEVVVVAPGAFSAARAVP